MLTIMGLESPQHLCLEIIFFDQTIYEDTFEKSYLEMIAHYNTTKFN